MADTPTSVPPNGKLFIKLVISKNCDDFRKNSKEELLPSPSQFVGTVQRVWQTYFDGLKDDIGRIVTTERHYVPELCCIPTKGNIDLDAVLAEGEIGKEASITTTLTEIVSRNFVFEASCDDWVLWGESDFAYELDQKYHVGDQKDAGGDVQLYHDLLRLWGYHAGRPASISKKIMDDCFEEIAEKEFTGIDAIARNMRNFVFHPHSVKPSKRDKKDCPPNALLLHGPPGTGKTTIIRSILDRVGVYTVWLGAAAELKRPYIGQTEKAIKYLFDQCRENPHVLCCIFWDEIDNVTEARSSGNSDHKSDWISLLLRMIGSEDYPNLLLIGSTNRKLSMDEAILRPGRMNEHYFFGTLGPNARWELFRTRCGELGVDKGFWGSTVESFFKLATINMSGSGVNSAASHVNRVLQVTMR